MGQSVKTLPGPQGDWLLGSIPHIRTDTLGFEDSLPTYGDIVHVRFAGRQAYYYFDPAHVHQILVTDARKFRKAPVYRMLLRPFLGDGLLTSDGEFWRRQRRLAQPAFHKKRIDAYAQVMVDYTEDLLAGWQPGQERQICHDMMELTLRVVGKTLFDADIGGAATRVYDALTTVLEVTKEAIQSPFWSLTEWLPIPRNFRRRAAVNELDAVVMGLVNERRAAGADRGDLLSMLLLAEDEDGGRMSDRQLRDEAVTLVLAGHETTANALAWTWYLLAQHPEVEAKLHAELDAVLGNRPPTLDDLPKLEYTFMVIKESMRLYPPIPAIARQPVEPVTVGGYDFDPSTIAVIATHVLHRDPRWWSEPDRFDPERFHPDNEANLTKYAYLPFGGGPRICIGNSFAEMEARLVLATIAQRYRLILQPGQEIIPEAQLTLRPRDGIRMRVEPRHEVTAVQETAAVTV